MKELETSERCKIILVRGDEERVSVIDLPYGGDTVMEVLQRSLDGFGVTECGTIERRLSRKYGEYVFVRKDYVHKKVAVRDIAYLEADRNYCRINLCGGECLCVSIPMLEVYEYLPPDVFKRIHRSFIVNLEHVDAYIGNMVILKGGKEMIIGREYREAVKREFVCIGSRKRVREKKRPHGG